MLGGGSCVIKIQLDSTKLVNVTLYMAACQNILTCLLSRSPVFQSSSSIYPGIRHRPAFTANLPPSQVGFQKIQQAGHSAEQQHPVPSAVQLDQKSVQHTQLATLAQHLSLICRIVWRIAQGRVVAHLWPPDGSSATVVATMWFRV